MNRSEVLADADRLIHGEALALLRQQFRDRAVTLGEQRVVDEEVAGAIASVARENGVGGVGHDLRLARGAHDLLAAEPIVDGRCGDGRARRSCAYWRS